MCRVLRARKKRTIVRTEVARVFFPHASEHAKKSTVEVVCRVLPARERARQKKRSCVSCVVSARASECAISYVEVVCRVFRASPLEYLASAQKKKLWYDMLRCIVFLYPRDRAQTKQLIIERGGVICIHLYFVFCVREHAHEKIVL